MAAEYDSTEFIDGDFKRSNATPASPLGARTQAPSREEIDSKVAEAQARLADLKRAQEELERERSALEETRRRQLEFQTGRNETIQNLTRALGLLEEAEFSARRDAEQMAKSILDLRSSLAKVQAIQEETWTKDNFPVQLTQALTAVENARMEWNSARLKFPVLSGDGTLPNATQANGVGDAALLNQKNFMDLCRYGLALTWPVAVAVLAAGALIALLLLRH